MNYHYHKKNWDKLLLTKNDNSLWNFSYSINLNKVFIENGEVEVSVKQNFGQVLTKSSLIVSIKRRFKKIRKLWKF